MERRSFYSQLILFALLLKGVAGYGQAPSLSYPAGTHAYPLNSAISPLAVTNTGGAPASNGTVSTFAGGSYGTTDGTGTAASFEQPLGAITDNQGNIYIADGQAHNIRKITPAGVVTTLAGSAGYSGFTNGTGAPATFWHPVGLAADASGNIYVADEDNNAIRMITPGGVVTTVAGTGSAGSSDGAAGSATFYYPCGVAVDGSGNVYVADYNNNKIRKISNGVVSTFAGSGSAGSTDGTGTGATFNHPFSVGVDGSGNVYVTDRSGQKIRKITPAGVVTTLAGSGTAGYADGTGSSAMFNSPTNLTVDQSGNVYVTDETNQRIRMVSPSGVVTTVAGTGSVGSTNGAASSATFNNPFAIAVNASDNVYVGDAGSGLVRQIVFSAFSVSPSLPAGLVLNNMTGTISGTPTATTAATGYTVTASNSYGTATATVTIATGGQIASPSQDQNYIVTYTPRAPITDITQFGGASVSQVNQTIQYFDGLGRPIQTVDWEASPAGNDVVQPMGYDQYGREVKRYLPYALTSAETSDGRYKATAITDQTTFYASPPSGVVTIPSGQVAYAATNFDNSSLNRVVEQGAPGLNNQLGGGHTITMSYNVNTSADQVKMWVVNPTGGASYNANYYAAGALTKTISADENQHQVITFKDLDGRIVSKWVQSGTGTYLITDYVYDDIGRLAYVVPPLPQTAGPANNAAVAMPTSFTEADQVFLNFFYGYHYDGLNRPVAKKIPGQDWQYMVYNTMDQLVMTQDANQRSKGIWMVTKYDGQGRVVITGEYATSLSQASLQSTLNGKTRSNSTLWETFSNSSSNFGYTNVSYPDLGSSGSKVLAAHYYDKYDVLNNTSVNPNAAIFIAPSSSVDTLEANPVGLPVATLTNVLGTNDYLFTLMQYDSEGDPVSILNQHYQGGAASASKYDARITQYAFTHIPTSSIRQHYQPSSSSPQLTINNWMSYDHHNRLILNKTQFVTQTVTGNIVTFSKLDYNELGQQQTKHLHSSSSAANPDNSTFLQHVDYRYNARGSLSRINNPANLTDETYSNVFDVFAEQLDYDQNSTGYGASPQYNGNISAISWQSKVPGVVSMTQEQKGYVLAYDYLNRLTNAATRAAVSGNNQYDEMLTYDELGNILSLTRKNGVSTTLNSLSYNYTSSGIRSNILQSVADGGTEGYNSNYTFDSNGNVTGDSQKSVSGMSYNELNLPQNVPIGSKTIYYIYDAAGTKLERITKQGSTTVDDRSYDNGIEYSGSNIDLIHTAEGRALPSNGGYFFQYQVSDHLGNVRSVFGDSNNDGILEASEIVQASDYYAFGREITSLNAATPQRYKYNGKELQDDLNEYDYGARFYDPVIARWTTPDPLAEKWRPWSSYNYTINNPIRFIDPDGREIINERDRVTFTAVDALILFNALKQISSSGKPFKIHLVEEKKTPNIYDHTLRAFRQGQPPVLHYDGDQQRAAQRRYQATKKLPPRGPLYERDEYPYASTFEGGAGASVEYVPTQENRDQGTKELRPLYRTMTQGEAFINLPVPEGREPDAQKQVVPQDIYKPWGRPTMPFLPLPTTIPNVPMPTLPELPTMPEFFPEILPIP